ncbi:DEAD/DEAH box helicase family protein [Candidatus Woesearchaeota archaeon]|nr:DEAD/DEAH box helicase family protein [Candidatus Woesearchaeota archaeon]
MLSLTSIHFPHSRIREGQEQLINDIDAAFTDGKILLAHAPTGMGKTAAALSVAVKHALEKKKRIFFLTNRHTQHRLAVDTLKLINQKLPEPITGIDLIGKRWMCSQDVAGLLSGEFNEYCKTVVEKGECEFYNRVRSKNSLMVEAKAFLEQLQRQSVIHNEELMERSKEKSMCSYEIALALAKKATIFIGDYNYVFNSFVQNNLFQKLEIKWEDIIVIVDEGHNLPGRITDMLSNELTTITLKNGIQEAKKYGYGGVINWLQEIHHIITSLATFPVSREKGEAQEKLVAREEFQAPICRTVDYEELINELEIAADEIRKKQHKSYLGGIASFLGAWKGDDKGYARILSERLGKYEAAYVLSYSCLDPSIVSRDIFQQVHAGVIMSGTLKPTFMYKDILGIERGVEQEYASPFPPENKLSVIIPETTTKYTLRNDVSALPRNAASCHD